jgi:uncharacterized protein (DUF169 family)
MEYTRRFKNLMGGIWLGVTFYDTLPLTTDFDTNESMRFCQAIRKGREYPVLLTSEQVHCPGAMRSFGWASKGDSELVEKMRDKLGFSKERVTAILDQTPRLQDKIQGVVVGDYEKPDLLISYCQPATVMRLLRLFQKLTGENMNVDLSSILSVCGNVAVKCFFTGNICLSFGCDDAREYGAISRDRLVVGVPYSLVQQLSNDI